MITNGGVTFWHYDDENEKYIRTQIASAWAICTKKAESDGSKGGKREKASCNIRIPTAVNLKDRIHLGDYARLGIHDEGPQRGCDLKVISITDNRYGLNPHWRVCLE